MLFFAVVFFFFLSRTITLPVPDSVADGASFYFHLRIIKKKKLEIDDG